MRLTPRHLIVGILVAALTYAACVLAPLRVQGGDTIPGRFGAAVYACTGSSNLGEISWLHDQALHGKLSYFAQPAADGTALISTFGPGPALLGAPSMLSLKDGSLVDDRELLKRARYSAAASIALASLFLFLALIRRTSAKLALFASLTAGLSFAGAASLGQGLWQQTAALPFLILALALIDSIAQRTQLLGASEPAREPRARLAAALPVVLAPPALAVALWIRPVEIALIGGLSLAYLSALKWRAERPLLIGSLLALVASLPFVLWNAEYLGTILPTGQLSANQRMAGDGSLTLAPSHLAQSIPGLLISPARGLLFFAPIALYGAVAGLRSPSPAHRFLALGAIGQLALSAAFYKWWGGLGFGPRLLAFPVWTATYLAFAAPKPSLLGARLRLALASLTIVVGLVGALRYDPRGWEIRRDPDRHQDALWDLRDSPLREAVVNGIPEGQLEDAPNGPYRYCGEGAHAVQLVGR